ncbi:MAG: hypothetical protein H7Y20_16945 [Bryobacteraceae bacterium]|nr:hypothetical protein [Bryobacteraceae bacterium]
MQAQFNKLLSALPLICSLAYAAEQVAIPLDNSEVRVLSVVVHPHDKTRLHEHKVNRVMVYLDAGAQHFEFEGGKPSDLRWKAGEPKWSPMAGMHTAEITSAKPVRIVEVELKKPGSGKDPSGPMDPLKVDPKHYRLEFENDQVRVVRVKIGPGETAPMHEHKLDRIVVYLTDQDFRITSADGKVDNPKRKAGEVSLGTPSKHTETNVSTKPFEIIMIELKS